MTNYSIYVVLIILAAAAGIFLIWKSRQPRDMTKPTRRRRRTTRMTLRTRNLLIVGIIAGIIAWAMSGYAITVILIPLVLTVGPGLFGNAQAQREIARLSAMEEWMRNLAGVITVGYGLEQAILATGKSIPRALDTELNSLLTRIRHSDKPKRALDKFADDLNDSTGDMLVGMLKLALDIRPDGLAMFLNSVAAAVADDVRGRRQAETGRAGARTEARGVAIATVVFLTALVLFTNFMAPYKSGVGQVVLLGFLAAFLGCLLWMRHITRPVGFPRFLGTTDRRDYKGSHRLASATQTTGKKTTP